MRYTSEELLAFAPRLVSYTGFIELYYEFLSGRTPAQAYNMIEDIHTQIFDRPKYASKKSFEVQLTKYNKRKRRKK